VNFCSNCGQKLTYCTPPGDDRSRPCCEACGTIHYQNPAMVVGCIPEWDGKILLCRRAIEPRYGKWTLPAGYLENGETVAEGAARETYEEARARVEKLTPYALYSICYVNQVYLMFRSRLVDSRFKPGSESLEVKLFAEDEIPWENIAFRALQETLIQYFKDHPTGQFPFYMGEIFSNNLKTM
jgi:ADP-ribose pyrophosphatase YjhB (NUDIX family)